MRTVLKVAALLAALLPAGLAEASADTQSPAPVTAGDVPAAAPAAAAPEPFAVGSKQIELSRHPVSLKSRSVLVVRADNGDVLYRKNVDRDMPIASITKLMTATVVLDAKQPLEEELMVTNDDVDHKKHTRSRLAVGTRLSRGEFMQLALMASENRAASVLARNYPGGQAAAVAAMNRKAVELGMTHTHYVDGTGLSADNRSSPVDLVRLVKQTETYPEIRHYSTSTQRVVKVGRRQQVFHNTNPLVKNRSWSIELTKTGYINEAGRCLVMQARIAELPVILVLMDSNGKRTRVGDANRVRKWLETALPRAIESGRYAVNNGA